MPTDQDKTTRKLRAILSADVKGYSLLMADDEAFTIKTLKEYRNIMSAQIVQHNGRVVDSPGDNILAEFASVVDAVACAVEIQKVLKVKNEDLPDNRKLAFRIGVNIGDIVQDGDRIYGNGVNVAARIEGIAEPGGVSISRNAYDHIRDKFELGYEYLGEHSVKNIKHPVRVYKILLDSEDAGKLIGKKPPASSNKWLFLAAVVATMALLLIVWQFYQKEPVSTEKPSIAVLPFDNMSNDPEQEYFSDGMTDELIGDLAKIKDLFVISRNSVFTYKGKAKIIQQIAKELNVQYILEGSVQRSGNNVRIRAQLIDGETDHHLWSESYDGVMDDIFELQDKITEKIVTALAVKLTPVETDKIAAKETENIAAHDLYLVGKAHLSRWTPDDVIKAIDNFKRAIALDPGYSQAYVGLAQSYHKCIVGGKEFFDKVGIDFHGARHLMRHNLELAMKKPTAGAYSILAYLETFRRHYKLAIDLAKKAVELSPNDAEALHSLGRTLTYADKPNEAIQYIKKAMRLNPLLGNYQLGYAYMSLGNYEKALASAEQSLALDPKLLHAYLITTVSNSHLGRFDEAKKALTKWLSTFGNEFYPDMQFIYSNYYFNNPEVFNQLVDGLVKAGFKKDSRGYFEVDEENKLNGQEIKKLFFGKTSIGNYVGFELRFQRSEEGKLKYSIPAAFMSYEGRSWIEGDMLCNQYNNLYEGVKQCSDFYRNPDGSYLEKSQYLAFGDAAIFPFSIEE